MGGAGLRFSTNAPTAFSIRRRSRSFNAMFLPNVAHERPSERAKPACEDRLQWLGATDSQYFPERAVTVGL